MNYKFQPHWKYANCTSIMLAVKFNYTCFVTAASWHTARRHLRGNTPKSGTKCTFVMSKSRVAPIKPHTMPRLELLAAVLGAELSKYLSNTILLKFSTSQIILRSDSQIVLSWISSSKPPRQQFIRHRVQLIRDITLQST